MSLTLAQLQTLKSAIAAETNPTFVADRTAGATGAMAAFYNLASAFVVWRTFTQTDVINNEIGWSNLTPTDVPDSTQLWSNRSLCCQGKQFNLQTILGGKYQIATNNVTIRNGLQDALTAIPSGVSGASQGAGWLNVKTVMQRFATVAEALYATGTGTALTPGSLVFEGSISDAHIVTALRS